jgi:predicted GTPase
MLIVFVVVHNNAQVLGQLLELLDIVRNELWGTVVVLQQLDDLASDQSVRAAEAEKDREE